MSQLFRNLSNSPAPNSSGCLLLGIALFFGPLGLLIIYSVIHQIFVTGDIYGLNLYQLAFGILFIIAAILAFKEARQSRDPQTLFASHVDPVEQADRAKPGIETELALNTATELSKRASQFGPLDRKLIDRVKEDILKSPSQNEVVAMLKEREDGRITLTNSALQLVAFAIKPTNAKTYLIGVALEMVAWSAPLVGFLINPRYEAANAQKHYYEFLRLRRVAKRCRLRSDKALQRDERAPILYLRSFSDDYEDHTENYSPLTSEERLSNYYKSYGPVITAGKPDEDLPLLGATRIYFDDTTWAAGVIYLMSISQLVILEAGFAPGLLWELGMARQRVDPQRLIISFAGTETLSEWNQHLFYLRFKKYAEELLECEFPADIKKRKYVLFEAGWKPKTSQ